MENEQILLLSMFIFEQQQELATIDVYGKTSKR